MSRIDKLLHELRRFCLSTVPRKLLGPGHTWIHYAELRRQALFHVEARAKAEREGVPMEYPPEKEVRQLLRHAQELLSPFAASVGCVCSGVRWRNTSYTPPAPFGDYVWHYTCRMVQEVLWLRPPFRAGLRFGVNPRADYRDANPYGDATSGRLAWDCGYILGLAWEKQVLPWLAKQTASGR